MLSGEHTVVVGFDKAINFNNEEGHQPNLLARSHFNSINLYSSGVYMKENIGMEESSKLSVYAQIKSCWKERTH